MKNLSEYVNYPLRLVKSSLFGNSYNFTDGSEVLASFRLKRLFTYPAMVTGMGKSNIEFIKKSLLSREILIREEGKELPFAVYRRGFSSRKGYVELPQGNKLLISIGFFLVRTEVTDEKGNILVTLKRANIFSRNMIVNVVQKSGPLDENSWVLFLALSIIIRNRRKRK